MRGHRVRTICILALLWPVVFLPSSSSAQSLREQNEGLFEELQRIHGLSDEQMHSIRRIFSNSGYVGQGNPAITRHPVTPQG